MHNDTAKAWERRGQPRPNPSRQILACRVLQALNLVEVVMVELLVQRLKCALDVSKVHYPTAVPIDGATNVDLHPERVPMQSSALMIVGDVRQAMRSLNGECLERFH